MASDVGLPPGFKIDNSGDLPPGFTLDKEEEDPYAARKGPGPVSKVLSGAWDALTKGVPTIPGHPQPVEPTTAAQIMMPMVMGGRGMMNSPSGPVSAGTFSNVPSAAETSAPVWDAIKSGGAAAGGLLKKAATKLGPTGAAMWAIKKSGLLDK